MAAKVFEVGDILPATTQLRISWTPTLTASQLISGNYYVKMASGGLPVLENYNGSGVDSDEHLIGVNRPGSIRFEIFSELIVLEDPGGTRFWGSFDNDKFVIINTTGLNEMQRTVADVGLSDIFWEDLNASSSIITNLTGTRWEFVNSPGVFNDFGYPVGAFNINFTSNGNNYILLTGDYSYNGDYSYIYYNSDTVYSNGTWTNSNYRVIEITGGTDVENETLIAWLEANATQIIEPSVYTITFDSNGGTTISDIEDATELPTPLPSTTKPGYTFGGWYYESNFQTRAKAGDTIEANTTLYAKWLTLAQVLEHINNVVEELRSAIIDKGGDAEGKLLIDFATIINSLKTYEVVETLAELELLEPTLNRIVFVVEGSGELTMGAPVKVTQDGDTLIIG